MIKLFKSFWGKYEEFNDEKNTLDRLMKFLKKIYKEQTKIPEKLLDAMFKRYILIQMTVLNGKLHIILFRQI